jgi:diguanylate cyclase (GGDEF)-like protein
MQKERQPMRGPLLVLLERDDFARELYTDSLVAQGFRVRAETQLPDALAALKKGAQLFIAGIAPGSTAVAELVAQLRHVSPATPLLVILSRDSAEGPLRALRDGALEALTAPVSPDALALGVYRCLETVTLFHHLPELHRHVELYNAAQRLMRAPDVPTLAREILDAAAVRLPAAGLVIATPLASTDAAPRDRGELIAARGLDDDDLRELYAAWDAEALAGGEPMDGHPAAESPRPRGAARKERFEDRVLTFPPGGGPFARVVGQTARLQPGLIALRIGPRGRERLWAMLFPPPRTRRDAGAPDGRVAADLGMLAAQASFALDAAERFPDGGDGAIDPLTDLVGEPFFTRTLEHEIRRHLRQGGPAVAVLVVELEGLPDIVEVHGQLIGERLLVEAARVLVRTVRELDLVARIAPRELAVLLMGSDLSGAERSAERVRRAFAAHRFLAREGLDLRLAVAVGVAAHPQHGDDAPSLRDSAGQAARAAAQGA